MDKQDPSKPLEGRYILRREIARGAMGRVHLATHAFTTRPLALKLLMPAAGPASAKRLLREARILGALRHPYVVEVIDAGVSQGGEPFLVMEMLDGRPLDGILATRRQLSIPETLALGVQLAEALAFVHGQGILHRDIKPSNVFVARSSSGMESIRLIDFGIARYLDAQPTVDEKLTLEGEVLGTPEYMAPEQLLAERVIDHRADLYSAGALLFECLTGDVPYPGTYPQVLMKLASATGTPSLTAARPDVPPQVARPIERTLQRAPGARYAKASDLVADLRAALHAVEPGWDSRPLSLLHLPMQPPPAAPAAPASSRRGPPPLPAAALAQRRKFARAPYVTPILILHDNGPAVAGRSEDISEGGLLVLVDRTFQSNEPVEVRFALPISGEMTTASATARWVKEARGGRGAVGLEFSGLSAAAHTDIAQFVRWMCSPEG